MALLSHCYVLLAILVLLESTFGYHRAEHFVCFANSRLDGHRKHSITVRRVLHAYEGGDAVCRSSSSKIDSSLHLNNAYRSAPKNNVARITWPIQQTILKILSRATHCVRTAVKKLSPLILSLALLISSPMQSWAANANQLQSSSLESTSPSSSFYLQNNPRYSPSKEQNEVLSIQTQRPQYGKGNNSQYKVIRRRSSRYVGSKRKQRVKRISMAVLAASIAASSFRASLRKTKIVRNVSPFGIIRNASPLGNGVSVIRVCMALGFDNVTGDSEGNEDLGSLLKRLALEEKELYTKIATLSQLQIQGSDAYRLQQNALGDYLSNVSSTFLQHTKYMRYGSLDSIRVPFVEEAVKSFHQVAKDERQTYNKQELLRQQLQSQQTKYVLATVILAIKGDHTSITLPFGIIRQRDMVRALTRIATDAKVEDCLVASIVLTIPNIQLSFDKEISNQQSTLTKKQILKAFPDLVPLT